MKKYKLVLEFDGEEERDWFSGQLTDGFGENFVAAMPIKKGSNTMHVDVSGNEYWEHHLKMKEKYGF